MATRILVVDDSPTLRKVVSSLLERHGYEATAAADGQFALEMLQGQAEAPFDLVLLDFVMPRMNGFQFCRALRQTEGLRGLPIVLMSAKSDKIREQFVQQTGAIDAITKPFDAQALVAVIENAIRRSSAWRAREQALSAGIPEDFDPAESLRAPPTKADSQARRARAAQDFTRKLAAAVAPALVKVPASSHADEEVIATALATGLGLDGVLNLAESAHALDLGDGPRLALWGDISIIPIGAVLQLLQVENGTGTLAVFSDKSEVDVSIRAGLIDLVQARNAGEEFRLGRYFVEHGLVTPGDIDALLREETSTSGAGADGAPSASQVPPTLREAMTPNGTLLGATMRSVAEESASPSKPRLIGEVLVESGRVTKEQLRDALARQSSELVYEVLRWQKGRFEFRREPPPALAESAQLGLPVASVVIEGFRRVDEWRDIEAKLGSFESVLQVDDVAVDTAGVVERLARQERTVLDLVDGSRTLREIILASHMSSFDACRILFQLLEARLVRRRAPQKGEAGARTP